MWSFLKDEIYSKSHSFNNGNQRIWSIKDAKMIIGECALSKRLILGGDIINEKFKHTYCSWHYNFNNEKTYDENCECAVQKAEAYIEQYILLNGESHYVDFVITDNNKLKKLLNADC